MSKVEKMGTGNDVIYVYVKKYPFAVENKTLLKSRAEEIEKCSHPQVKREKFYDWKLLEFAAKDAFGLSMKELAPKQLESGKWVSEKRCFSLSHSGDFVAVAIAKRSVGVDVQLRDDRFSDSLSNKITTRSEREKLKGAEDVKGALNALWTKKEAIFKMCGEGAFAPKNIETGDFYTQTNTFFAERQYFLSVCPQPHSANEAINFEIIYECDFPLTEV